MGGGVGGGVGIDSEPSPRRAAIEKAQAELRQEFVVREERRRELEFLEKGGNPLDFKFGETTSIGFQCPSPTDPLAEQKYLTSEAKGRFALNASPNGDSAASNERPATLLGRGLNTTDNLLLFAGDIEATENERVTCSCDGEGNVAQEGQTSQLDGNQIEPHVKELEDSGGVRLGVRGQAYTRRNRYKSTRNYGHSSLRDTVKVSAGDRSPTLSNSIKGHGDAKDMDIETHADKNGNVSSINISNSTSLNRNGIPEALIYKNNLGTASEIPKKDDISTDVANIYIEGNHPGARATASSEQEQCQQLPREIDIDKGAVSTILTTAMAVREGENQASHPVNDRVDRSKPGQNIMIADHNLNQEHADSVNEGKKSLKVELGSSHKQYCTTTADVGKLTASETNSVHFQRRHGFHEFVANEETSTSNHILESTGLDNVKETTGSNYTDLHARRKANYISEDKLLGTTDAKIAVEEGLPDGRLRQAEVPRIANMQDIKLKCLSGSLQEKKIDGESGGIISSEKGTTHPQSRGPSPSGVSSNKSPGVAIPSEKEKDSTAIAEMGRQKANLSAAAKKAHEDLFLEEAKAIKVTQKKSAEWAKAKPFPEPPRRKSHWDFVLEEMAWMANDFMQERRWKMAAAAQVSRWVVQERGQTQFQERDPHWTQRKDAHVLATAVMKFWQSVEAQLCWDKHEASLEHGSGTPQSQKSLNEGASVQREIGESSTIENKKLEAEKLGGVSCLPVQQYAIRFLKCTKTSDHLIQAEAPSTPERLSDAGILKPSWEDQFPEESLFYTTPCGAMKAYRNSVESYWASLENHEDLLQQDNTEVWTDTDAQAGTEASDEAMGLFKYGMCDVVDDTRSHSGLSPQERAFGGDEDELRVQYLPGAFEGSKATKFARKKRKIITKASMPKTYGGRTTPGESHGLSLGNKTETNAGIPSPLISGKRSFPSSNLNAGAIPIKRVRSSTVAARQRAAGSAYTGITGASSLATKTDASSGDTSSLQEEFSTLAGGSQSRKAVDIDSAGACGKYLHYDGADVSMKSKKKKKSKHFGTGISSTPMDTAGNSGPSGKGFEYEQKWPQDVMSPHEQREQTKRKVGSQIFSPSSFSGSAPELQMTNSQGFLGQPATKKSKLSKQLLDSCLEAATPAMVSTPSPVSCQISSMSNPNRFSRMIANRDRGRKSKTVKGTASQAGASIPWSTFEDQALVVLVHDVGPNWEFVSDIINSSLQIKCIFRKPEDCKERHKSVTERTVGDGGDSPEDSGSPQPYPSTLHGIPKGSARLLLQRLQGPMEEETLKTHFERIVQIGGRQHSRKVQNDNEEQKQRAAVHPSHSLAISQLCSNSLTGGFLTPLDLCDQTPSNTEMQAHAYQFQASQATGLGMANPLGTVSAVQPSAGIPSLQGTSNLPLATGLGTSSAALNVAASSRDVQRLASGRPMSVSMDEQRLQQYNQMVAGRSLQSPGIAVSVGLQTGLPSSNDRGVLMLNAGNAAGMVSGLSRGMPLPRPGFPGIGSPGILSMVSSGISNMRPSSGVGLPAAGTVTSGAISAPGNMIPRSRESLQMLRSTQSPEDQRQLLMQEFQLQAAQGNGQATTAFNNLNSAFSNQMVSSPPTQNFPVQHQQHQVPPGHNTSHHSQPQNPNHSQQQQAYMLHLAKERQLQQQQHQRLLQQQQQFPAAASQLPQSQSHPLSQTQHTMSSLPNVPHQPHQQQHSLPQHKLPQQQTTVQQQSTSQSPPTLQHQPPQQSAASSLNPSLVQNSQKQQSSLPQTTGQSSQVIGQSNLPQQNQIPKQQQQQQRQQQLQQQQKHQTQPQPQQKHQAQAQQLQQVKVSKGLGRGGMIMQNMPSEPIQANGLQGSVPGNQLSEKAELGHLVSCQRMFPGPGSLQPGKQMTQSGMAGQQGQGPGQAPVSLSQTSNLSQQQRGFLQQPSSKLQTQVLLSAESHQVSVPSPTTAQQQQQLPACQQQASSIPIPPLASSSQLQQRQPMQPQQAVQRRLPQRLTGSDVGLQSPLQLGKNCVQQDQVTSQLPSQPGHVTFQVGSNVGNPLNTVSASPGVPLASAINSNTTGAHSAQWKPGQNIPQKTSALYNLPSNSSASNTQISPVVSSSGMTITSSNGNAAVSTPITTGIMSHGASVAGLPQRQYAVPVVPVHGQNVGGHPAIGPRPVQRMGAQWQPQQAESQQQQRQVHNGMQISTTTSLGSSYIGPPTSGPT